jgi:hypothetical protein
LVRNDIYSSSLSLFTLIFPYFAFILPSNLPFSLFLSIFAFFFCPFFFPFLLSFSLFSSSPFHIFPPNDIGRYSPRGGGGIFQYIPPDKRIILLFLVLEMKYKILILFWDPTRICQKVSTKSIEKAVQWGKRKTTLRYVGTSGMVLPMKLFAPSPPSDILN